MDNPGRSGTTPSKRRLPSSAIVTTSFLIANLHCPSCVSAIKEALHDACGHDILWVSPNIVTSVVAVQHKYVGSGAADAISRMARCLGDTGFEISTISTTAIAAGSKSLANLTDLTTAGSARGQAARRMGPHSDVLYSSDDGPLDRLLDLSGLAFSSAAAESRNRREAHLANYEQCRLSSQTSPHSGKSPRKSPHVSN
ncbi:hypothetical protein SODALDRAFT_345659, partial [Sodiomyces alkalinus F11]